MGNTTDLQLEGHVAVITGGGRGLGRATALELVGHGASVVINDVFRDESGKAAAELLCDEIVQGGGAAAPSLHDISTQAGAAGMVSAAVEAFGRVDILVTCAGNFARSPILEVEDAEWESITGVHLDGHLACMSAAARRMREQGDGGRIVTVSSRGALFGSQVAYSGAKAGIMGLTVSAARELQGLGITVNCLLPSAATQLFTIPASARRFGGMPETLHMEPDFVAPLVAYLCSPAARGVTGQMLYAAGTDICTYRDPLAFAGTTTFARHARQWSVEELADYLPSILPVGGGE